MSRDRDDDFLSRWSRRKAEARAAPPPEPEAQPVQPAEPTPPPEPEMSAEEIAALPPIETAGPDALKAYLRKGVPAALKTLAMRRMWAANPLIRDHVDPALDYAFDWNTPGMAPWSPLGAGDDAKGIAERILNGPDRRLDSPASDAAPEQTVAARREAEADTAAEHASAPPQTSPEDGPSEAAARSAQVYEPQPESPTPAPASRPGRRRHGGAAPT